MSIAVPVLSCTLSITVSKRAMARPSMATMMSPGWMPPAAAALLGCTCADFGRREGLSLEDEDDGEHQHREDEIGDRPGGDHCRALRQALVVEGDFALLGRHGAQLIARHRGGIGIAEHLDVAAERDGAELPARAGAIVPAEELRAEADREDLDAHAVAARDQIVAELVNEDQDGQDDQEGDDDSRSTKP